MTDDKPIPLDYPGLVWVTANGITASLAMEYFTVTGDYTVVEFNLCPPGVPNAIYEVEVGARDIYGAVTLTNFTIGTFLKSNPTIELDLV